MGMVFLVWAVGSIAVGIWANNWKGRNLFGWMILAAITSPLLAALLLLVVKNENEATATPKNAEPKPHRIFQVDIGQLRNDLQAITQLSDSAVYTTEEAAQHKRALLRNLRQQIMLSHALSCTSEQFLAQVSKLLVEGLLSMEEIGEIKKTLEQQEPVFSYTKALQVK